MTLTLARKAPKGTDRKIANYFMEISAQQVVGLLKEFGIRASYQQQSRRIDDEPFVEHSYDVLVSYVHIDEWHCALRILASRSLSCKGTR